MTNQEHQELLDRLDRMETKVDAMSTSMDKLLGAWGFAKILGSIATGTAIVATAWDSIKAKIGM